MDLITLIAVLLVVGLLLWVVLRLVPMPIVYRQMLVAVIVILVLLWVIRGVLGGGPVVNLR